MKSRPATNSGILVGLGLSAAVYCYILFGTRERGSGMDGMCWMVLGFWGGVIAAAIAAMSALNYPARRREAVIALTLAATLFGLIGVVRVGGHLYRQDQEEAKQFVERRIAAAEASGGDFPATQQAFIGGEPLPRLLRGQKFYSHDGGRAFHIDIRVDFDGGGHYHSERRTWRRST